MSYNDEVVKNLHHIESNGLKTIGKNLHGFISNGDDMIFSEYNLFTTTGRPSNRFGGVNFAALNKSDGSRKHFISRFEDGVLLEFDFDAYHLRLIGKLVDYDVVKEQFKLMLTNDSDTYDDIPSASSFRGNQRKNGTRPSSCQSRFGNLRGSRVVSGKKTIGASRPFAPCTVITRTAPPV